MNIVLIGFRCAGKTTVGELLAKRLQRSFIDCDEYIEKKTNLSIREIFDIAGESYFRMLEGDAIADLSKLDGRVIATGGGAVLKYTNIRNLHRNAIIIFLDASHEIVLDRLQNDLKTDTQRPPLTDKDPAAEIREQMAYRRPYYMSAADAVVATDGREFDPIVADILEFLEQHGITASPDDDQDAAIA